jgi:hypothetical protein
MPNIPTLWVGPPGVGKTATVTSTYDYVEIVLLSAMTEEDIMGIPYQIDGKEHRTQPPLFQRLQNASRESKTTALFLDEIDKARREVADTLLTLVASRRIGEHVLPDNCDIVAAANPPEWGGGDGVSQAMQSRFSVRHFTPNVEGWASWFVAQWKETPHETLAQKVADLFTMNTVSLLEVSGTGWDWRLTCPRTVTMAFMGMVNAPSHSEARDIAFGLLTARTADAMMSAMVSGDISTAQKVATKIVRSSTMNSDNQILRISF